MGDHHDRVAISVHDLAQECEHAAPGLGVQRSGRLIGEHNLGAGDERAGDRDALLLAAGELRGTVAQAFLQADPRGDLAHLRAPWAPTVEAQRQGDVLGDRERRHQVEGLKDEPDPLASEDRQPPLAETREVGVPERDGARGRTVQPRRHVQERALARSRRPHDGGERPRRERDADLVECDDRRITLAMDFADIAQRDRWSAESRLGKHTLGRRSSPRQRREWWCWRSCSILIAVAFGHGARLPFRGCPNHGGGRHLEGSAGAPVAVRLAA